MFDWGDLIYGSLDIIPLGSNESDVICYGDVKDNFEKVENMSRNKLLDELQTEWFCWRCKNY